MLKRFLILILIINFLCMPVLAFELDTSIDDDIRKNYNPDKIEEDGVALPPLPKIINIKSEQPQPVKIIPIKTGTVEKPASPATQLELNKIAQPEQISQPIVNKSRQEAKLSKGNGIILKRGTKVKVRLLTNISDKTKKGSRVKFVSIYPVSTTYFTIPMGTEFYGQVVNSHKPQLSANGGLIEVKINSVVLNGDVQPINAYVTKAASKHIFFNNIKGKRKYLLSMAKSTRNGRHFFQKMLRVSGSLATDGSSIILTPFSLGFGLLAVGGNVLISPALALFYKGESIHINSGNNFEIKLSQDVFLY